MTEDHLTVDELTLEKLSWYRWKLDLDKHTSNKCMFSCSEKSSVDFDEIHDSSAVSHCVLKYF